MSRAVEILGGGLLGILAGSLFCAPLIAHVFGPTTVTWDATACPPGIYTITATARSADGSRSFTATTQHIRLPRANIEQDFGDLPFGQYLVSAIARDARGRTFGSDTQTVTGQGPSRGRQPSQAFLAANTYAGGALPRSAPLAAPGLLTTDSRSRFPVLSPASPATVETAVEPPRVLHLSAAWIELLTAPSTTEESLLAAFPSWKSITFIDSDDDGLADAVRIEWNSGDVWMAAIGR